jgi:hypothetical protein
MTLSRPLYPATESTFISVFLGALLLVVVQPAIKAIKIPAITIGEFFLIGKAPIYDN